MNPLSAVMTKRLAGIFAPVVTPFSASTGDIDFDSFTANLRAHLDTGVAGAVVTGSTGEAPLLEEAERSALIEAARGAIPADRSLIVGTGAESTRLCVRRCRDASERGADAVLVVSPHYYLSSMTPAALERHFLAVADASPCPVLLYNIPKYAHLCLEPDLVARLSTHENIHGMKDSAGDLTRLAGYLRSQSDEFTVLTGHGGTFLSALDLGVRGGILAVALFAGELTFEVLRGFQEGDSVSATEAQAALTPLAIEIVGQLGVAGAKAALDYVGLRGGPVRSPLLPLAATEATRVQAMLREAKVSALA